MSFFIPVLFSVIGGCLIAASVTLFRYFAFRRFLGEFWGRLRQSHGFTLLQLLGTGPFWKGAGLLGAGVVAMVMGWSIFRDPAEDVLYSSLTMIIAFISAFVTEWFFFKRHIWKKNLNLPNLPAEPPTVQFTTTNPDLMQEFKLFESGFQAIYSCLHRNLQVPFGKIKTWFAIPGSKYPSAYLWDTCFISGAWRLWDARTAQEILRPFLDLQDIQGLCPQSITLGLFPNYSITNPPLLAFALLAAAKMTGDYTLLPQYLSRLQKFAKYMEDHRRSQGLFRWTHSYESGLDNSPRFTNTSEAQKRDLTTLWAVDLNVWMVLLYLAMAELLRNIEQKDRSSTPLQYEQQAETLLKSMIEHLWDSRQGLFYDYDPAKKERVEVNTIASLLPITIKQLPAEIVTKLIAHIENPAEYNTPIPLPTVARNDPLFVKDCWQGPVWINTAWAIIHGLCHHGENTLAGDMAYRLVKGVYETYDNCGSFYEFYDPDSPSLSRLDRKKGNLWKRITLGNKPIDNFCGWTALVNTLLLENVIGYARNEGKVTIQPKLPKHWCPVSIHVKIPQFNEEFEITVSVEGKVTVITKNQ